MSINTILNELAADNSRLAKEKILTDNKDNQLLKDVFVAALNPYINYYIKKIPEYVNAGKALTLEQAMSALSYLKERIYTGNDAITHLANLLSCLDPDDAGVIIKIIRRDLRCGVSTSTVNKIWKDLIPEYPCLLCSPYDEKTVKKIKWPAMAQLKSDGARINGVVVNNACTLYTRKGSEVVLSDDSLANEFIKLANGKNVVFDGELVAWRNGKLLPRKESNGIANKAIRGTITPEESKLLHADLWDIIPYEDFIKQESQIKYKDRYDELKSMLELQNSERISLIETFIVNNLEETEELFQRYLADGKEGIILKNMDSLWSHTRSKEQIKFKAEKVCELRVVGWNFGEVGTKNEHRLGSLMCASEDKQVIVNVSGFTDIQRDTLTMENTIDKIVSVMYNERIKKKNGGFDSLFLPRIVCFRDDKDVADTEDLIK